MQFPDKKTVVRVRAQYPPGTRVELLEMDDPQAPPVGTRGIVIWVDDTASLCMSWDNGSTLNVVYGQDRVRIVRASTP
ncbi:MAG: DUF4314 domain-containing protein [Aristaeellaceae bacterium]